VLNDGTTQTVTSNAFSLATNKQYTYTTLTGDRFLGFNAGSKSTGIAYNIGMMSVYYGPCTCTLSCAISLDLSPISPLFQTIFTGSEQNSVFTVTENMIGTCTGPVNVRILVVAPSGGNAGLITSTSSTGCAFAASNVVTNAGAYTVTV
jgi:hypothetical protein